MEFHFFWGQNKVRDLKSNSKRCKRVGSEKNISHLKCLAGVRRSTSVDWSRQRFTAQQRIDCTERVMTGKTPMGCHSSFRLFFFVFSAIKVSALFLVDSWLQRWFLCSCVGTGEKFNCCFDQYIHFTLFIVCDLSSLQAARIYDKQVHLYREEKHILRGFPWFNDFLANYSCW